MSEHAREMIGNPMDWEVFRFRSLGAEKFGDAPKVIELTGAMAPRFMRGKRSGERNWQKRDRGSERTVYITPAEHAAWLEAWSARTGLCRECAGKGEVFARWHHQEGTTYKPCRRCGGTGQAGLVAEPRPEGVPRKGSDGRGAGEPGAARGLSGHAGRHYARA